MLGFLATQFLGGEFAAQAHVVVDANGLIDPFGPMRHDMFDQSPGADRFHIYPLVLVELRFRHDWVFSRDTPAA